MNNLTTVITTLTAAAILAAASWGWRAANDKRDGENIRRFLASSTDRFRSTHAIAAAVRLSEERVAKLCANHPRIRRNELEKQSWRLVD
ncbi:MAG: hypothetical protein EON87_12560 [Brevundimonas sp.]|nr:MAG: hypothetical protein EON87_12560 [Brevundimonas sp.]